MLKRLFTSNARIKLLTVFLANPEEQFFIRELTRKLDEQINSVRRELTNLQKLGLLQTNTKNRKKYYRINPDFIFLRELSSIFNKTSNDKGDLISKIEQLGEIKLLVLSGVFIHQESPIDLLLVGKIDKDHLGQLLEAEVDSKEPVKFTVMNSEDFLYRLKCNDLFITQIIRDENSIIAINKLNEQIKLDF